MSDLKEKCKELAIDCESRANFKLYYPFSYFISMVMGWLDEFYSSEVIPEAVQDVIPEEFTDISTEPDINFDDVPLDAEWVNDSEMNLTAEPKKRGRKQIWTKEACFEESKKYQTRSQFQKGSKSAYAISQRNGWLDEFFGERQVKYNLKELAYKSASRYKKSTEFKKKCKYFYKISLMHGWLKEFYPDEFNKVSNKTTYRSQILDYVESCNRPVTKKEVQVKMLEIAGQPLDRWEYGVSYIDNVSIGQTVFLPSPTDSRYLKPVWGKKKLYQICKV